MTKPLIFTPRVRGFGVYPLPAVPELPEIEHLRRTLAPWLIGSSVRTARLLRADIATIHDRPDRTARPRDLLAGARIERLERRGKQLAIIAEDGRVLCVQLGMSGRVQIQPQPARGTLESHTHCTWKIEMAATISRDAGIARMTFRDPRRFGGLRAFGSYERLLETYWLPLGPDALTIEPSSLESGLAAGKRPIKAALLDQSLLAGVGNIYADEALFRAGIHPLAAAGGLSSTQVDRLAEAIRATLRQAIDAGGSSLRDYVDAAGRPGNFKTLHQVYGRAGQPCVVCGETLVGASVAQRTTVWCPRCQSGRAGDKPHVASGSSPGLSTSHARRNSRRARPTSGRR